MSQPLVETTGLTAHYGDAQALYGIDFRLMPGELLAIIGANSTATTSPAPPGSTW